MGVKTKVRLHLKDGRVVTESLARFATANGLTVAGARELLGKWLRDGDIRERPDGGYDVIRFRPRRGAGERP